MAYGGNVRKPMAMGGMMSSPMPQKKGMQMGMNPMQPALKMGKTIPSMKGDLDKDGKMSGYETARQAAIQKNMKKKAKA
jgi:hypothetical protein